MKKLSFAASVAFALSLCALLIFESKSCSQAVVTAIDMCIRILIPALFPFLFLSQFCLKSGLANVLASPLEKATKKFLKLPSCAGSALIIGFIGGYPVGAKYTCELFKSGYITKEEAEELILCCNNCGPAFFFGAIGAAVFSSAKIALLLWLCHIVSALITYILLERKLPPRNSDQIKPNQSTLTQAFCSSCWDAAISISKICSFVILFKVFTLWLDKLPFLINGNMKGAASLIKGFFELTSGIVSLDKGKSVLQICLAAFITGWGGICVHMQTLAVMQASGIKLKRYIIAKLIQGFLSAAIVFTLLQLFETHAVNAVIVLSKSGALDINAKTGAAFLLPWVFLAFLVPLCTNGKKDDDKL